MLKYQVRTLPRRDKSARPSILDAAAPGSSSDEAASPPAPTPPPRWSKTGPNGLRLRSASVSSLSSAGSSTEAPLEWGTLKIYTGQIRSDTDYKTVFASTSTTAGELVRTLLAKFRLGNYKDPKLYYLSMHIRTRREGSEVDSVLGLEEDARPLELQACHPRGRSRFQLHCRHGIRVKVHDHCLSPQSNYKSILISGETTCAEGVALVLQLHRLGFPADSFVLVSVNRENGYEFLLPPSAFLASAVAEAEAGTQLHLRPFTSARLSLTASGRPSFDEEEEGFLTRL